MGEENFCLCMQLSCVTFERGEGHHVIAFAIKGRKLVLHLQMNREEEQKEEKEEEEEDESGSFLHFSNSCFLPPLSTLLSRGVGLCLLLSYGSFPSPFPSRDPKDTRGERVRELATFTN